MSSKISKRQREGVTIIDCQGSIDLGTGSQPFLDAIREEVRRDAKVLLNLADVQYVSDAVIGQMVSGFAAILYSGGQLKLLNVPEQVMEVFQRTLLARFDVYDDEVPAVQSFGLARPQKTDVRRRAA